MSRAFEAAHAAQWFQNLSERGEPWLLMGKGPSFAARRDYDLSRFNILTLNHVIREQSALVAHMIDFDVFEACADAIERNARYLLMPWVPHINLRPTGKTIQELMDEHAMLQALHEEGRLIWYNLGTAKQPPFLNLPVVRSGYFSAEVAVNLLCDLGVRTIRTLGVDGGTQYARNFDDLNGMTRLSNQHESYDRQFRGIARRMMKDGLDFAPLNVQSPVRVFVGSRPEQEVAVKVLEYSIRKHASLSVEVVPIHKVCRPIPLPENEKDRARTHFSFQRFMIPELCDYRGRAIYLDSDMLVLDDIRKLWEQPFDGNDLLCVKSRPDTERKPQFSVLLLNCETLRWNIDGIIDGLNASEYTYQQLMYEMIIAPGISRSIEARWNSLEHYEPGHTALIHYTDIPTQPWISTDNPHGGIWIQYLIEALEEGCVTKADLQQALDRGYIRPSLYYQVKRRMPDVAQLPTPVRWLDRDYVAPFQLLQDNARKRRRLLKVLYRNLTKRLVPFT